MLTTIIVIGMAAAVAISVSQFSLPSKETTLPALNKEGRSRLVPPRPTWATTSMIAMFSSLIPLSAACLLQLIWFLLTNKLLLFPAEVRYPLGYLLLCSLRLRGSLGGKWRSKARPAKCLIALNQPYKQNRCNHARILVSCWERGCATSGSLLAPLQRELFIGSQQGKKSKKIAYKTALGTLDDLLQYTYPAHDGICDAFVF